MGVSDEMAHASLRFGLGRFNTAEQVEYVAGRVVENVNRLRKISPLYEVAKPQDLVERPKTSGTARM
jgi:cysteine desulfurase